MRFCFLSLTHLLFLSVLLYSRLRSPHSQSGQLRTVFRVSDFALSICVCVLMARALIFASATTHLPMRGIWSTVSSIWTRRLLPSDSRRRSISSPMIRWVLLHFVVFISEFAGEIFNLLLLFDWHVSKEIYLLQFVGFGCSDLQLYVLVDSAETTGCRISRVL